MRACKEEAYLRGKGGSFRVYGLYVTSGIITCKVFYVIQKKENLNDMTILAQGAFPLSLSFLWVSCLLSLSLTFSPSIDPPFLSMVTQNPWFFFVLGQHKKKSKYARHDSPPSRMAPSEFHLMPLMFFLCFDGNGGGGSGGCVSLLSCQIISYHMALSLSLSVHSPKAVFIFVNNLVTVSSFPIEKKNIK